MPEESERERLRRLEQRIAAAKGKPKKRSTTGEHYSQASLAWRMVTELVAGIGIGLVLGLGLDTLFGTAPVLMVVFLGLGFAAGIRVMLRTAREVQAGTGDESRDAPDDETRGD